MMSTVLVFIENSFSLFLREYGSVSYLMMKISWVGALRPADIAIQMAVYTLSPVIIQILMRADRNWERQYWISY
jgi:hypothetical protein